jgi:2-dehydropantoate 2-reductase
MKVGIIGAGAMGSLFSYYFLKSGKEVVLYEKDRDTVEAIKKGLTLKFPDHTETINVPISSGADILKGCRYLFIFVKSYATAHAIRDARQFITADTRIISLQNGLGNKETIRDMLPDYISIYGTTTSGASKADASTVYFGGSGEIQIGGASREETDRALDFLNSSGFVAHYTDDPDMAVWRKAIINAGINPLGALLDIPNGEIIRNEHSLRLQRAIVAEAVDVARSQGIMLEQGEMQRAAEEVCETTAANICSMLQDFRNRRHTEIESITGEIIAAGKNHSIKTPVNESMYHLIKARESYYLMS